MTDLIFHRAEKYIKEDLDYYFAGDRDIHSQVKPGQNIYSFTPESAHLEIDYQDGKIGQLFYPFAPATVERIYIGISFPLFANSWGAAFLRHLMTLVKPKGCVVLPVYPEIQAAEKNFWSRSILENIFISRSRWKGMSNIWAENDGVMSMRIGRRMPPEINSNANYLLRQGSQSSIERHIYQQQNSHVVDDFLSLHQSHWHMMQKTAIIERIIQDTFGRKSAVNITHLGDVDNAYLATELILSPYVNIEQANADYPESSRETENLIAYHQRQLHGKLRLLSDRVLPQQQHVITAINYFSEVEQTQQEQSLQQLWQQLTDNGLLIVHECGPNTLSVERIKKLLSQFGEPMYYSSLVASQHHPDEVISHYSSLIEEELAEENATQQQVFWVLQKSVA